MPHYQSNLSQTDAINMICSAKRIAITTHAKPDGDAFGSVVAMTVALRSLGHDVTAWLMGPVPGNIMKLDGYDQTQLFDPQNSQVGDCDLFIILDTGAVSQLGAMVDQIAVLQEKTLIIDHHLNGDWPAKWRYIDGQAAACCEIVAQFVLELGVGLEHPVLRDALFTGIAADTGWFRFSNTRVRTHETAARLLQAGTDHADLYARLQQNEKPQKLKLMIRALDSLQLLADDSIAVMVLCAADFLEVGACVSDTEQFVDLPQMVASVQVVVLITEPPPETPAPPAPPVSDNEAATKQTDPIRISFRSKPGPQAVNVALLAQQFQGGGHARAAGAKMAGTLDQVVAKVTQSLVQTGGKPV